MLTQIIILLSGAILGFVVKIVHSKLTEKKVGLIYELDKPAKFTPPPVWFQKLRIWNKGNLPAHNLLVHLTPNITDISGVEYEVDTQEPFDIKKTNKAYTLRFERLRPKEDLSISIKFNVEPPHDLLLGVKCDEGIAYSAERERSIRDKVAYANIVAVLLLAASATFLAYTMYSQTKAWNRLHLHSPLEVSFSYSTHPSKGEEMSVKGEARNTSGEVLRDSVLMLKVPGLRLDYNTWYQKKELLRPGERFTFEKTIPMPKDMPNGQYEIVIESTTNTHENHFWAQTTGEFQVR